MSREILIYCDESVKNGTKFSNFYGGLLIFSDQYQRITNNLNQYLVNNNINGEVKWQKVGTTYLDKYKELVDIIFSEVKLGNIKIRIMFQKNTNVKKNLTKEQRENTYFLLYYQFLKHSFGLRYLPDEYKKCKIRFLFDEFPETKHKIEKFKDYILELEKQKIFKDYNSNSFINISRDNIVEVNSKNHVLLQILDLVLGSIPFRLNNIHKIKNIETNKRGNKTIAKEQLYKHIYSHLNDIRPRFNIGKSTGKVKPEELWHHNYRHWEFIPKD